MNETDDRLKVAMEECEILRTENARLRSLLDAHGIPAGLSEKHPPGTPPGDTATVHKGSTPDEKLRLFRSLFRGREDVYALRWEKGDKLRIRSSGRHGLEGYQCGAPRKAERGRAQDTIFETAHGRRNP